MTTGHRGRSSAFAKVVMGRVLRAVQLLAVGLLLVACSFGSPVGGSGQIAEQQQPVSAAPPGLPPDGPVDCPEATVRVGTAIELHAALAAAVPGTVIAMADGTFDGDFTATSSGTVGSPIWLCGGRNAVLRGRGVDKGYVLYLQEVENWRLVGFTVREGQKGLLADGVAASVLQDLAVTDIGDEAVHLRAGSRANVLRGLVVSDTGRREPRFGEGIYVGSAVTNWCEISQCEPDRSDGNLILDSVISGTTAEAIDIKEGTTGGVVRNNSFDGADMRGDADSWVDVKGNGWLIQNNRGTSATGSGFEVHQQVEGWGTGNVFDGNIADVRGSGYGFDLHPIADNRVMCTNSVLQAARGYSNAMCG